MSPLNKYLKVIKLKYSMSGDELAAVLGVSSRQVNNYISGLSSIPMKNVYKLSAHLDISVAQLIQEAEEYYSKKKKLTNQPISDPIANFIKSKGTVTITLDLANQAHLRLLKEYLQINDA